MRRVTPYGHSTRSPTEAPLRPYWASMELALTAQAEAELAVGFFGSRYERATPAEREYLWAMADVAIQTYVPESAGEGSGSEAYAPTQTIEVDSVTTADVARHLDRKPQSLSLAPDARCSRRGSSTPPSAAGSRAPCRTSGGTCATGVIADVDDDRVRSA